MQNNTNLYKWRGLISRDSEKGGPGDRPYKGTGDPGRGDGRQNRRWKTREQLSEQKEVNKERGGCHGAGGPWGEPGTHGVSTC